MSIFRWLNRLCAAIFAAIRPLFPKKSHQSNIQKETSVFRFYTPDDLTHRIQDRNFQLALIDWTTRTLRPLEDDHTYLQLAKNRSIGTLDLSTATLKEILNRLTPFIERGTPAHELGHHTFDALGGAAIISDDPFVASAYRNEVEAAFLAAFAHDGATGVQHRYVDNKWELDHGEIFAWVMYHLLEGLVPEPVRLLTAYAIAAHPHKVHKTEAGTVTRWRDELFYDGSIPVRLAVWVTRWTDRLENGADPACHLPRHALANVDGARVGGLDLHGVDWYSFTDSLKFIFTPRLGITEIQVLNPDGSPSLQDGQPVVKRIPSMLQHLHGYAQSAVTKPQSIYNLHDDKSPNMRYLMDWKLASSTRFISSVIHTTGDPNFEIFVRLMQLKSGLPNSQTTRETIDMVRQLWALNSPDDQAHWAHGFELAITDYFAWIQVLQEKISHATDPVVIAFQPLVPDFVSHITEG